MNNNPIKIDMLLPDEMARKVEDIGVAKAKMGPYKMLMLAVLAGAFIAFGAIFATTVTAGSTLPYGVTKLLGGFTFSLGLILVIVGGAELFTGNNLISVAWASGKVPLKLVLRNWGIVYIGNLIGSIGVVAIMLVSKQYAFNEGAIGLNALNIGNAKCGLEFWQAMSLGVLCNILVCLAVWLCFSARSTVDKIAAIIFPITAFVAAGFEHSIANMYFVPKALLIKATAPNQYWETIGKTPEIFENLTLGNFLLNNLIPVTIGNIFGGAILVGLIYWFIFLRKKTLQ